ncbi:MAG: RagB/SusD family nutrient uptake outer membrane protein [Chitinophagaceae bacterium]
MQRIKIKYFNIIIAGIGLLFFSSCKKYLDTVPSDVMTEDQIFDTKSNVDGYLAQIYANIPDELDQRYNVNYGGPWVGGSDEGTYMTQTYIFSNALNTSTWSTTYSNGYVSVSTWWSNFFKPVRTATDFMSKIDNANSTELSTAVKTEYKAEARALRAIFYYWLVRQYGPVPIISELQAADAATEDLLKARNTMDSCINFIVEQLDSAYTDLRTTPLNSEYGRITKGVAKAYKEQALLLAASPLFNGNTDMASLKDNDGTQLINQTSDATKWEKAATAAKDFIDEFVPSVYSLYTVSASDTFTAAYLACRNVITTQWNSEWIFGRTAISDYSRYDKTPKLVGYNMNDLTGGGFAAATQTIVDAYFMKNGLSIDNANSGYSTSGYTTFKAPFDTTSRSTFNQWVNREPRFYVGITYNNSYWIYQPGNDEDGVIVNYEYSGNSGRSQSVSDVSATGYNIRKGLTTSGATLLAWPLLRLAQIYLDYAEALNEYSPGNTDIMKYLNLVRERAGIPTYGSDDDQIPAPSGQTAVREAIRHERQVELAFENVRYFDCHRWKTAMTTDNLPVYGMNMYGDDDAFYQKTLIQNRTFRQRDYLWPIPYSEILNSRENLVQNPGW